MKNISGKLKEHSEKLKALAVSGVVAASGVAGAAFLQDDVSDAGDQNLDFEAEESPKEISNQVDENKQKMQAISGSSNSSNTDYRLLGC